jgi:hypothetical protein
MKRVDLYLTEEQYNKLEDLHKEGLNKSFFIRRALDLFFESEPFTALIKSLKEKYIK